ncbi:MAG: hypothetical protein M1838_003899 [Thelocarpon superellum]|nr:MAG: hypothetical protein M1838_003899 [Thelocarpon superellum]
MAITITRPSGSFYTLSKTHHPDHNPDDPGAAKRFIQVAEAYAVLGSPERKGRYDRDLQRSSPSHARGTAARHGSHSSTAGPAGGRPASGLSRRRSQFRGPPPSFYRSGGWGEQSSKRRAQANAGTSSSSSSSSSSPHANSDSNASPSSSSSTKQDPTADYDNQEYDPLLSHFDRVSHKRTQEEQDRRRRRRMAEDFVPVEPDPGALVNFLFVGGVLTLAVVLPFLALGGRGGL